MRRDIKKDASKQRQHYVSETYQKRFEWNDGLVHYRLKMAPNIHFKASKPVAFLKEKGIYDFSTVDSSKFAANWVECCMTHFDGQFSNSASKTIDIGVKPSIDEAIVFATVGFTQYLRTPKYRAFVNDNRHLIDTDNADGQRMVNSFPAMMMAVSIQLLPNFIKNLHLNVIIASGDHRFISADNPVSQWYWQHGIMHLVETKQHLSSFYDDKSLIYPLSPKYLLEMKSMPDGYGRTIEYIDANDYTVKSMNSRIAHGASKFLIVPEQPMPIEITPEFSPFSFSRTHANVAFTLA